MTEQWQDVTKAVAPEAESPPTKPPFLDHVSDEEYERGMRHDEERMGFETLFYAWLLDRGWESVGISDCVMCDRWAHPTSQHSGRRGHELIHLLGFSPEDIFDQLLTRRFKR
jgi:hypothetical protein